MDSDKKLKEVLSCVALDLDVPMELFMELSTLIGVILISKSSPQGTHDKGENKK